MLRGCPGAFIHEENLMSRCILSRSLPARNRWLCLVCISTVSALILMVSLVAVLEKGLRQAGPEGAMRAQARYYEDIARTQDIDPSDMATIYAVAGDLDRAFVYVQKTLQERDPFLVHLLMDPRMDALREDLRFGAIRARLGLEN